MKKLETLLDNIRAALMESHDFEGFENHEILDIIENWLNQFKDYLPSATASEHAKGAHDAVDDLISWINVDETIQK